MRKWLFLALLLASTTVQAQYYNERVLEKSFEQMDFFFESTFVNPYGIGGFGSVAPGLIDDPLLNQRLNPAYAPTAAVADGYLYLNFRSSHDIEERDQYYPSYGRPYDMMAVDVYYPHYFVESRKELEPVISLATFFQPLGERSGLIVGFDYQAILQDEAYYEIPQDIYRTGVGEDFNGSPMVSDGDIPIVDRYSGEDKIHHEGHFFNLTASLPLNDRVDLGARLGRALFDRDGAYGSQNLWEHSHNRPSISSWYNMTGRDQSYDHWDTAIGLNLDVSDDLIVGVMGGRLSGEVTQSRFRDESSMYQYGTVGVADDWSVYERASQTDQSWKHDGDSRYGGINVTKRINRDQTLNLYYRYTSQDVDIQLGSSVSDTSYSNYHHEYESWQYSSESTSALVDTRSGTGNRTGKTHAFGAALQWQINNKTRIQIGANVTHRDLHTRTVETVDADRFSQYEWDHTDNDGSRYYAVDELKELHWDFESTETAFHLPVLLDLRVSPSVDLQIGVKRSMRRWKINDVTLALFDHRTVTRDDQITADENFGERYTQPEEKRSDVTTTMLVGVTVEPSEHLEVRFLMVPNFEKTWDGTGLRDLQWWIDFRLF